MGWILKSCPRVFQSKIWRETKWFHEQQANLANLVKAWNIPLFKDKIASQTWTDLLVFKAWDIPWYVHQGLSKETLDQFQGGTKQFQDI